MAKKTEETRALAGPRVLQLAIPSYNKATGMPGEYTTADGWEGLNGWFTGTTTRGKRCLMYESYLDLSGYTLDGLSFIPGMATLQDPGAYFSDDDNTPIMEILDIMSQERLNIDDLADLVVLNNMPGLPLSTNDWDNIIFGQYRLMMNSAEFNESGSKTWLVAKQDEFGSGGVITAEKLYCYRFIRFLVNTTKLLSVPASRLILSGAAVKEADLVYLQRLKRTYETQGSV